MGQGSLLRHSPGLFLIESEVAMHLRAPRLHWDGAGPSVLVRVKAKGKRPPKVRRVPVVLEEP
jgi:hypothetical protein